MNSANLAVRAAGIGKQVTSGDQPLTILDGVELGIDAGQTVAIVGRSGSGKTTLLSILAGLDLPSCGEIALDGQELTRMSEEQRARFRAGRIGFVFQSFQLLPGFTALENVMLPCEIAGQADAEARATSLLKDVGLAARSAHYPQQLSGGEQQRVALARAFAGEPSILFADEPTGNLDTATGAQIIELMFAMNRDRGTTLVLVTHDEALAKRCQRRLELREYRLHESEVAPA